MKRLILSLLLIGLLSMPIGPALAYTTTLSGQLYPDGSGGFTALDGDVPTWTLFVTAEVGGTLTLYDYFPPLNDIALNFITFEYVADTAKGIDFHATGSYDNYQFSLNTPGYSGIFIEGTGTDSPYYDGVNIGLNIVPVPASVLLLASGLLGLVGIRRKLSRG